MEESLDDLRVAFEMCGVIEKLRSEDGVVSAGSGHREVDSFDGGIEAGHRNNFN